MTKHTTITLDEDLSDFVEMEVERGNYKSSSDVVAAALRLLEESKLEQLRAALQEGEESGYPDEDFNLDEFLAEMHKSK
jgi:antitoxin ParD1/3/4